jgi:hypothetical protein
VLQEVSFDANKVGGADLTGNWLKRVAATATSNDSREAASQLSGVLDYYNSKKHDSKLKEVDWEGFKNRIHTPGVVDKIHAKYDKFMSSEYKVDAAVGKCGAGTDKMQALDTAMQYNFMLYFVHYMAHLDQIETVRNVGDITNMSTLEMTNLMPGLDMLGASKQEIADISPEDYIEDGVYTRLCTQFSWGTRYTPPFVHSSDSINAVVATLGKLGT